MNFLLFQHHCASLCQCVSKEYVSTDIDSMAVILSVVPSIHYSIILEKNWN